MKRNHTKTLVLNADFTPMGVINWKRAVVLSIENQENPACGVEVIDFYKNDFIESGNGRKHPIPAVVRIPKFIRTNKHKVPFSRKNVFMRDELTCQYCGYFDGSHKKLTYDHVIPRVAWKKKNLPGTPTNWSNIVTCCITCNRKKSDRSVEQCGMKLLKKPIEPSCHNFVVGLTIWQTMPAEWEPYLAHIFKRLKNKKVTLQE